MNESMFINLIIDIMTKNSVEPELIRSEELIEFPYQLNEIELKLKQRKEQIIDTDTIVGVARSCHADNWLEALSYKYYHKLSTLERFNSKEEFQEFLLDRNKANYVGVPSVVKSDSRFYIYGDGYHRLTLAKVLGRMQALVVVYDLD